MDGTKSNKRQAEGEGSVEMQRNVIMATEILNCSFCREPLRPEIYQCSCERFICKTCHSYSSKSRWSKKICNACSGPFSHRAYGMERVLANILVPCKYECAKNTSWCESKGHEMYCLNGPAVCPIPKWAEASCGFVAPKAALLAHMSTVHKCPATSIRHGVQFDVLAEPGSRVLRGEDDQVFLLTVSDSLSSGNHRAVYIEPVGRLDPKYDFGCTVSVTWESFGRNQHRSGSCDSINVMVADPTNCLCFFPRRSHLVLKTIIQKKAKGGRKLPVGVIGRGGGG